jgi:hypothetical protein
VAPDDPGRSSFRLGSSDPEMVSTGGRPNPGPSSASTVIALLTCTSVARLVRRSSWSQDKHGSTTITVHATPSFRCDPVIRNIPPVLYGWLVDPGLPERRGGELPQQGWPLWNGALVFLSSLAFQLYR